MNKDETREQLVLGNRYRLLDEALRASEETARALLNAPTDTLMLLDVQGRILALNETAAKRLGKSVGELVGVNAFELLPPALAASRKARVDKVARSGKPVHFEDERAGIYFDSSIYPVFDAQGQVERLVIFARDITTRVQTEQALRQERDKAQKYLDVAGVILVALNDAGEIRLINRRGCEILGYEERELLGQNWFDTCLPTSVRERVKRVFNKLVAGEIKELAGYYENPILTRSGEERIIAWRNTVLTNDAGKVTGTLGSGEDVTARLRAEAQREAAHKLLQATIDGINEPILLIGDDYQVQLMNQVVRNDYGVGTNPLHCYQVSHRRDAPCDGAAHPCPVKQVRESLRPVTVVHEHVRRDGEKRIVEIIASPVLGEDGALTGIVEATRDITERVRAEKERDSLIAELEAKNTELENFTHTVSHDLKSPLITIQGFLNLLLQNVADGNTERVESNAAYILAAVEQMKQLLNELLKLSRIGRVVNPPEEVSMGDVVRQAVDTLTGQIEERGVQVIIAPALLRSAGALVYGDRVRLREVWENLLGNAVKYMGAQADPRVELGLRQDEGGETVFYARDNGIGIDPRFHDKIFGLFDQLDSMSKGVGAGLAIVKRIVEVHGGRVWVESEGEGRGSVFCFTVRRKT